MNCQSKQDFEEKKEKKILNREKAEEEINKKAEEEINKKAEEEINKKAEEEINKKAEEEINKKAEEEKDKFLRLFAEFENYKKRTQKERINLFKTAHQEVMIALIPILDDFNRGILEIKKSKDENLIRGIELIQEKFFRILKEQGLQEIKTKKGDIFNTDIHEAITQISPPSEELKGKIIEIIENGYTLNDKVIRHAKVIVGKLS